MTVEIDDHRLRNLYQAGVACKERMSRSECPSPKTLMRLLRSKLSSRKATKIVDHISGCGACAREFQFLLQVLRQEKTLIQEIGELVTKREGIPRLEKNVAAGHDSRRWSVPVFSQLSRGAALALAGSVTVMILISMFVISRVPERYRAAARPAVELQQPAHERISLSSLAFKWRGAPGVDHYTLELLDETLLPIWESGQIRETSFTLPADAFRKLEAGQSYFWMVTAHLKTGGESRSSPGRFALEK